jgi:hypothetical protein
MGSLSLEDWRYRREIQTGGGAVAMVFALLGQERD